MNRLDFQRLADERIKEAEILINAEFWSGAYYLAGYAVECALKACIAKQTGLHEFPDKDKARNAYTHSLAELLKIALLNRDLNGTQVHVNPDLYTNWLVVKDWSVRARYEQTDEKTARELHAAITDADSGVLPWVKRNW
jgi:HEPN domain-containing protein